MPAEEPKESLSANLSETVVLMRQMNMRSYPAECAEQSGCSEEKESSKQSLLRCGFPTGLRLRDKKNIKILKKVHPLGTDNGC